MSLNPVLYFRAIWRGCFCSRRSPVVANTWSHGHKAHKRRERFGDGARTFHARTKSISRPGPVATSKKFIRKYYATARGTGSRACRLNAVRDTPGDIPGVAVPLACHYAAPGRLRSDEWRARSVDSGRFAANRAPNSDQLRRFGQTLNKKNKKSLGKLLTFYIYVYIFVYTNGKPPDRAKG